MRENQLYEEIGDAGFRNLVAAFYRQVPTDDILGPMYPVDDLTGAEERLRGFLIFRCGGPQTYIEQRGHPKLRMRHAPFAINQQARDRWMQLMTNAIESANLPEEPAATLQAFLGQVATFLMNR